ncbi:hypothetical protein Tco_0986656 [Tanacetum coccineum]
MHDSLNSVKELHRLGCKEIKGIEHERNKHMLIFNACFLVFCHFVRGGFQSSLFRCKTPTTQTHERRTPGQVDTRMFPSNPSKNQNVNWSDVDLPSNGSVKKFTDTNGDVNVNAPAEQAPTMAPPTRTDDQILPRSRWVAVGKSKCYLDVERSQSNPIYKIAVDILKQTNFFRAFIASSTIPSIYIQQFWDTVRCDKTTGNYSCQLDEQWFDLTKDTLRDTHSDHTSRHQQSIFFTSNS